MTSEIPDIPEPSERPGHELDGTYIGAISGHPCVDKEARTIDAGADPHTDCRATVANVRPGDDLEIDDTRYDVLSQDLINTDDLGLVSLTVMPQTPTATISTLWVDREPYLLDVCNGGVYAYGPEDVTTDE